MQWLYVKGWRLLVSCFARKSEERYFQMYTGRDISAMGLLLLFYYILFLKRDNLVLNKILFRFLERFERNGL